MRTRSKAWWSSEVERWKASGVSAAIFAIGLNYSPKTLQWWSSKLSRRAPARTTTLVPVVVTKSKRGGVWVEVEARSVRVTVEEGFDADHLRKVVDALRGGE